MDDYILLDYYYFQKTFIKQSNFFFIVRFQFLPQDRVDHVIQHVQEKTVGSHQTKSSKVFSLRTYLVVIFINIAHGKSN